jgi:hypothetical protein
MWLSENTLQLYLKCDTSLPPPNHLHCLFLFPLIHNIHLWTCKSLNLTFCIVSFHSTSTMPHHNTYHTAHLCMQHYTAYHTCTVSPRSSVQIIMWPSYCLLPINSSMPHTWLNPSHPIISWLHWIMARSHSSPPPNLFYNLLCFMSEFSIIVLHPLIIIIVLYSVSLPHPTSCVPMHTAHCTCLHFIYITVFGM